MIKFNGDGGLNAKPYQEAKTLAGAGLTFVDGSTLSETSPDFCSNPNSVLASLLGIPLARISIACIVCYGTILFDILLFSRGIHANTPPVTSRSLNDEPPQL